MGSSLMWSGGLGNLPELELGPQVGWNVLVPSPTRLPSPLRLSSPNRRPLHSQRAAHMNDTELPWEMGENIGASWFTALLTRKSLLPP